MALACAVASTHYKISSEVSFGALHNIKNSAKGAHMLYKMVCSSYGNTVPIIPIRPEYILSTDDAVQFISEGKGEDNDMFRLNVSFLRINTLI